MAGRPLAVRAQPPTMPVVGLLHSQSADGYKEPLRGFRQGLKEAGYIEGENVAIEYRFAESQIDLLPVLAADLVRRPLAVIVAAGGPPVVVSAKEVTSTIPIVFITGDDPVRLGYVASLARSGGNLTGISFFNAELATKRLELLRTLVPSVLRIAVLLDPTIAAVSNATLRDLEPAARAMGMQIQAVNASTSRDQYGLRVVRARAARRDVCRSQCLLSDTPCAVGPACGASWLPRDLRGT